MEDIQNKADYDVKNIGVSYTHSGTLEEKKDNYNKNGLIPSLSPGAKNEASSTTHAAIGQGTITTTKEQIDLSQINRDTQHSLNELGKIFDKKKIEEKQELAKLFAKNADELLHDFSKDGSIDKTLAHGLVSEIASQIAGNKAGRGFLAGAANEALIDKIDQLANGNPAAAQWISAALGATVNAVTGGNANTGAMVAQTGTQWNKYEKIPDIGKKIVEYMKSGAYKKLKDGEYHLEHGNDGGKAVGVAINNKGEMIDFIWKEGEKYSSIGGSVGLIEPNTKDIIFIKTDSLNESKPTGKYSFEEYDGIATETMDYSSLAKNTAKETGNLPFRIAETIGANIKGAAKFAGVKLGVLNFVTAQTEDWEKYSGNDWLKAEAINLGIPAAEKFSYGLLVGKTSYQFSHSLAVSVGAGAISGILKDTATDQIIQEIKDKQLKTDKEKEDDENKGISHQGAVK